MKTFYLSKQFTLEILQVFNVLSNLNIDYGGAIYVIGSVDIDLYAGTANNNVGNSQGGFLVLFIEKYLNFQWATGWDYLHMGVEGFNNSAYLNGGALYLSTNNTYARFTGSGGVFSGNFIGVGYTCL